VGDTIQIGDVAGQVRRIGIRSTTVQTAVGAEVIVPNASLVADPPASDEGPIDCDSRA